MQSRGSDVAKAILGADFVGFLITDRWCGYNWTDRFLRQVCWAHLKRDFQGMVDRGGPGSRVRPGAAGRTPECSAGGAR